MSKDRPIPSFIWQLVKAGFALVSVVIYSRYLGASGRGTLSVLLLYVQLFLMFNELFVGSALANWIANYGLKRFLNRIIGVTAIMISLAMLLSLIFGWPNVNHSIYILVLLALWTVILVFQNVALNFFQSRSEIVKKSKYQGVFELLKLVSLSLIWVAVLPADDKLLKVLGALVLGGTVWSTGVLIELWNLGAFKEVKNTDSIKHTWGEGIWAQLGQIALFLVYRTPLFAASFYISDAAAGVLANTFLVVDTVWIFANTMGSIVHGRVLSMPRTLSQYRFASRYEVISFWGTLVIWLLVLVIPEWVYVAIFGLDFIQMHVFLKWMTPGVLALGLFASRGNLYHACNEFKRLLLHHITAWFFLLLCLVLCVQITESVTLTQLILIWNFALISIAIMHHFHRKFNKEGRSYFLVNTLLIWRLMLKNGRRLYRR